MAAARARFAAEKRAVFLVLQGPFHQELFVTVGLAAPQLYSRWRNIQSFCKQLGYRLVGLAIRGRGCRTNLQAAILDARYLVGFRTGMHANGDVQIVALDTRTGVEASC